MMRPGAAREAQDEPKNSDGSCACHGDSFRRATPPLRSETDGIATELSRCCGNRSAGTLRTSREIGTFGTSGRQQSRCPLQSVGSPTSTVYNYGRVARPGRDCGRGLAAIPTGPLQPRVQGGSSMVEANVAQKF